MEDKNLADLSGLVEEIYERLDKINIILRDEFHNVPKITDKKGVEDGRIIRRPVYYRNGRGGNC